MHRPRATGFHTPREKLVIEPTAGSRQNKVMVLDSPEIAAGMGVAVGAELPDAARVVELRPPELLVLESDPQPEMGLVERTITRVEFHGDGALAGASPATRYQWRTPFSTTSCAPVPRPGGNGTYGPLR
jgi:hypothetical protein